MIEKLGKSSWSSIDRFRRREHPFIDEEGMPFVIWDGENHTVYEPSGEDKVFKFFTFQDSNVIPFYGYIISEYGEENYIVKVLGLRKNTNIPKMQLVHYMVSKKNNRNMILEPVKKLSNIYRNYYIDGISNMYDECNKIMTIGLYSFLTSTLIFEPFLISLLMQGRIFTPEYFHHIFSETPPWHLVFSFGNLNISSIKPNKLTYMTSEDFPSNAILPILFPIFYDYSFTHMECPNFGLGRLELLVGKSYLHRFITNINFLGFGKKSYNVLTSVSYLENFELENYFSFSVINPPFLFKRSVSFDFSPVFLQNDNKLIFYSENLSSKWIEYELRNYRMIPNLNIPAVNPRLLLSYYAMVFYMFPKENKSYRENSIISYPNFIDYDNYYDIDLGIACELVYDIEKIEYVNANEFNENINIFLSGDFTGKSEFKLKLLKLTVKPKTKISFFNTRMTFGSESDVVKIIRLFMGRVDVAPSNIKIDVPETKIKETKFFDNEVPYYVSSIVISEKIILFTVITFIPSENDNFDKLVIAPLGIGLFSILPQPTKNLHIPWLKVFHYKKTKEPKHNLIVKEDVSRTVKIRIFKGWIDVKEEKSRTNNSNKNNQESKYYDILEIKNIQLLNQITLNTNIFTVPTYDIVIESDKVMYNLLVFNKLVKLIYKIKTDSQNNIINIFYEHGVIKSNPYVIEVDEDGNQKEVNIKIKAVSNFSFAKEFIHFRSEQPIW